MTYYNYNGESHALESLFKNGIIQVVRQVEMYAKNTKGHKVMWFADYKVGKHWSGWQVSKRDALSLAEKYNIPVETL